MVLLRRWLRPCCRSSLPCTTLPISTHWPCRTRASSAIRAPLQSWCGVSERLSHPSGFPTSHKLDETMARWGERKIRRPRQSASLGRICPRPARHQSPLAAANPMLSSLRQCPAPFGLGHAPVLCSRPTICPSSRRKLYNWLSMPPVKAVRRPSWNKLVKACAVAAGMTAAGDRGPDDVYGVSTLQYLRSLRPPAGRPATCDQRPATNNQGRISLH